MIIYNVFNNLYIINLTILSSIVFLYSDYTYRYSATIEHTFYVILLIIYKVINPKSATGKAKNAKNVNIPYFPHSDSQKTEIGW